MAKAKLNGHHKQKHDEAEQHQAAHFSHKYSHDGANLNRADDQIRRRVDYGFDVGSVCRHQVQVLDFRIDLPGSHFHELLVGQRIEGRANLHAVYLEPKDLVVLRNHLGQKGQRHERAKTDGPVHVPLALEILGQAAQEQWQRDGCAFLSSQNRPALIP